MKTNTKNEIASRAKFHDQLVAEGAALFLLLPLAVWAGGDVTNCTEASLRAAMAGGGLVTFACDGTITLASTITNDVNTSLDGSGHQVTISGGNSVGVFHVKSNVLFTAINLTIANGRSTTGAGIFNAGTLRATNCTFSGNIAMTTSYPLVTSGGAIQNLSTCLLSRCAFLQNQVIGWAFSMPAPEAGYGYGGAICNAGVLSVEASAFVGNKALGLPGGSGQDWLGTPGSPGGTGYGGALFNSGVATFVNSTIVSNSAIGGGGGWGGCGPYSMHGLERIYYGPGGNGGYGGSGLGGAIFTGIYPVALTNCTVAFNFASAGSGGYGGGGNPAGVAGANGSASGAITAGGNSQQINSILAGNTPSNCTGPVSDLGHNLCSDDSSAFTNGSSLKNADPRLGSLANNGGPTLTLALLPGSPAIDAGDTATAPSADQRGVSRLFGFAADIGAYEFALRLEISRMPPNILNLRASDAAGPSCRLLTSTNFTDWQCVATNFVGTNGTTLFQENCAVGETQRFYRVVVP